MTRLSRLPVFLLAVALFAACAVAFMGVDCGSDVGCAVSKLALGHLLIGLVVVFSGSVVGLSRAPAAPLVLIPLPAFSFISAPRSISPRAPPALL